MNVDELIRAELEAIASLRAAGLTRYEAIRRHELTLHVVVDRPEQSPDAAGRPPARRRPRRSR